MASALDVAAAVLARMGRLDGWKLQKLVYYCQAWHLVWHAEPLYHEGIEGWRDGPVCPALWEAHRNQFDVTRIEGGVGPRLNAQQQVTVDAVVGRYGQLSGRELRALTHSELPWIESRRGHCEGDRGNAPITPAAILAYHKAEYHQDHRDALIAAAEEIAAIYDDAAIDAMVAEAIARVGTRATAEELRDLAESGRWR